LNVPPVTGITENGGVAPVRSASDEEPFSGLVFKIMTDPFVGHLAFFRVYSGQLKSGTGVYNSTKNNVERIGRILKMHANKREEIKEVYCGDIAAAVGLKNVSTGDTICDKQNPIVLEAIEFPAPVISVAMNRRPRAIRRSLGFRSTSLFERILPLESIRIRIPGKRSCPEWESFTLKFWSTAWSENSVLPRISENRRSPIAKPYVSMRKRKANSFVKRAGAGNMDTLQLRWILSPQEADLNSSTK
jgi:hypothetical protein